MEDLVLFMVGYIMIGFALGSVMAIAIGLTHYVLKGRRGGAYSLGNRQDYST